LAAIGGVAVGARLVYGPGFESYDPLWSLIWGRQLTRGELPDLDVIATAPTSHPLSNLVGALASLFGQHGPTLLAVLSFISLGALAWAGFALGRTLFGAAVGVVAAFLFVTRRPIVDETLQSLVDIPFLAFVVGAAALEAQRPRRGLPVLALLGLAGLLRPEAWLLAFVYALYLSIGRPIRDVTRWGLAAAAAPLLWMAFDLVATGDPFHSLHGTRDLAGLLGRPRGAETALLKLPLYLEFVVPEPLLWAGLIGVLLGLAVLYRASLLPAVILALGLLSFLALGVAGLPLLYRYVFVPSLVLALFAAVALLGWSRLPSGRPRRVRSLLALPAAALVVALWAPSELRRLRDATSRAAAIETSQSSQRAALAAPRTRRTVRRCPPIYIRALLQRPILAYRLDVPPTAIVSGVLPPRGTAILASAVAPRPGYVRLDGNRDWTVYTSCAVAVTSAWPSVP